MSSTLIVFSHNFLTSFYVPGPVLGDSFISTSQQPSDLGIIAPFYRGRDGVQEVYSESNLAKAKQPRCGWAYSQTQTNLQGQCFSYCPSLHPHIPSGKQNPISFLIQDRYLNPIFMRTANNISITITLFR